MKKISMIVAAVALVAAFGCKNQNYERQTASNTPSSTPAASQATANTNGNLSPEQLGELGAKIRKNPHDAQKILSEQGLTEQSFEQQVRKVAEDPSASKRYADAYKKAKA